MSFDLRARMAEHGPVATPFTFGREDTLPRRQWLYGRHLVRGRVSLDVAAGGVGKTALKVAEAIAMASGQPILGKDLPEGPLRVWLYNLEDDRDELTLRLHAAAKFHNVQHGQIEGGLFVDSGLEQPLIIARAEASGTVIARPLVDALIAEVRRRAIDVLILDPFVSAHQVSENDNAAIDAVMKQGFIRIAHECNIAINLVHHIRKGNGEAADIDSARGASAMIGAARSVQVFNRMSEKEAEQAKVKPEKRKFFFRVTNEKANMAPPPDRADWYRMENVELANGEKVGAARAWRWPARVRANPQQVAAAQAAVAKGDWRLSDRSPQWCGMAIGPAVGRNVEEPAARQAVRDMISGMIEDGVLRVVVRHDAKRMPKEFVIPGEVSAARGDGDDEE